jgi:1,4-dihydroxy-2-naphthoate octaprenyltransferase
VNNAFDVVVFVLLIITTTFLQILSNLANDYGDTQHGADNDERLGPVRAVQSGAITKEKIKYAIFILALLCLVSGVLLLFIAFGLDEWKLILGFFLLGIGAIIAAIKYTAGSNPYGYKGFGDVFVFLFFGLIGVLGSAFLYMKSLELSFMLPAMAIGMLSTGVLNINNIRDIEGDAKAGKYTIAVRLGRKKAGVYHLFLITGGLISFGSYIFFFTESQEAWAFVLITPFLLNNIISMLFEKDAMKIDKQLKVLALSSFFVSLFFSLGLIVHQL